MILHNEFPRRLKARGGTAYRCRQAQRDGLRLHSGCQKPLWKAVEIQEGREMTENPGSLLTSGSEQCTVGEGDDDGSEKRLL